MNMPFKSERDYVTGVYRCKDPIKNLKIKVRLQRDKSTLVPLPQFQINSETSEESNAPPKCSEFEEKVIIWQEKIFSPFELSYYRSAGNCHSPLEEKYHNEVTELCKNEVPTNRIFTYTDADNYDEIENATNNITEEPKPVVTHLSRYVSEVRQRHTFSQHKTLGKEMHLMNKNIVEYTPSQEMKKRNHVLQTSIQYFYILADLNRTESAAREEAWAGKPEYVLCTLKYDTLSNVLTATPDFISNCINGHTIPYCVEVDDDSRSVFQYWLEHASDSLMPEEQEEEVALLTKLLDHHLDIRQLKVGTEFEVPRSSRLMIYIMGEIVSCEDFEYNNLFVHFLFELPKGWSCKDANQMSGMTQKCSTNGTRMVYFSHLFETHLDLDVESLPSELDLVPCWPQFLAEVLSLDSWGRFRVEGYCFVKIPAKPGPHCLSLPTWRPLSDGPSGEMRRFFVGGSTGLKDLSCSGIPATLEGDRLNKIGLRVVNSGTLHLRLHVVHQSGFPNSPSNETASERTQPALLERISAATIVNSVNSVMAAFKKARERMLRAKEGVTM